MQAKGYVVCAKGLEDPVGPEITLQKGAMYGMGASSSPQTVVLTEVTDSKVKYRTWPFQGGDKTIEAWIARDLLDKGTRTLLKRRRLDPKLKSSMESLLRGGKGRVEKLEDYKPIEVEVEATDPSKDEWYAAEEYGNVAGRQDGETMVYIIDMLQKELSELKKDRRFKVLKVKPRNVSR